MIDIRKNLLPFFGCSTLLFLMMFSPRIGIIDTTFIFNTLLSLFLLFFFRKEFFKNQKQFKNELFFFIPFFIALINFFRLGAFDDLIGNGYYLFRITRSISFFILSLFIIHFFRKEIIVKSIVSIILFNFIVSLGQLHLSGEYQQFFLNLDLSHVKGASIPIDNLITSGVRVKGFLSGFDSSSLFFSSLTFISLFYIRKTKKIQVPLIFTSIYGSLISARVGLVATLLMIFLYLIKDQKRILFYAIFSCFTLILIAIPFSEKLASYNSTLYRNTEILVQIKKYGIPQTSSTNDLIQNHFVLQNHNFLDLIFGKPSMPNNTLIVEGNKSDVGYNQLIDNIGILGLLSTLLYLFLGLRIRKQYNSDLILLFILLICCIKGPYFYSRALFDLVLLRIAYKKKNDLISIFTNKPFKNSHNNNTKVKS